MLHFFFFWRRPLALFKILYIYRFRDAFKKKKNVTNVTLGGRGGPDVKMLHFYKLCLKSISSHSESFWKKKFWMKNLPILTWMCYAKGHLQKKKCDKCPDIKMSHFIKLCLKSISSHSESFWKKNFRWKMGGYPHT